MNVNQGSNCQFFSIGFYPTSWSVALIVPKKAILRILKSSDAQYGFRKGISTMDAIFSLYVIINKSLEFK